MHGAYAANMAVSNCDVLFSIGTRFNDRITGKLHEFAPNAQIIHIDIDTASISRNIQVDIPIVADAKDALAKMSEYVSDYASKKWNSEINSWKQEHPLVMRPNDRLSPVDIINQINCQFEEAIIVTDVGIRCWFPSMLRSHQANSLLCPEDLAPWDTVFPVV